MASSGSSNFIFITTILIKINQIFPGETGLQEYCHSSSFTASCPEGHVILTQHAVYGRMEMGDCVTVDYGHLGCQKNVLPEVDRECSGRRDCSFAVSELEHTQPCSAGLHSYLLASYTCLEVIQVPEAVACQPGQQIPLQVRHGFLASITTEDTRLGSESCPWLLQAEPGQTFNITIWNFVRSHSNLENEDEGLQRPRICYQLARLTDDGVTRYLTECEGSPRLVNAHVSTTSELQIEITYREPGYVYFLLEVDVLGCGTPVLPPGTWLRRLANSAEITCNYTAQSWTLTCDGHSWVGPLGNCSQVSASLGNDLFSMEGGFPYGILMVVSVGVALGIFLGGLLLVLVSAYLKRKRLAAEQTAQAIEGKIYDLVDQTIRFHTLPARAYAPRRSLPSGDGTMGALDPRLEGQYHTYGYYHGGETPHYSGRSTPSTHIYESPTFHRKFSR